VTDLGGFWDWGSMYMSSQDEGGKSARRRTEHEQRVFEEAVSNLHLLFAHKLTTVWMLGEAGSPFGPSQLRYRQAWPTYLRLLATYLKPSNLNDTNAWSQLLDLGKGIDGVDRDRQEQERVDRSAPAEPMAFAVGHKFAGLDEGSELIAQQYPKVLFAFLAGVEELDYRRCGWGDEDASWLAVILPLCGGLKRLLLSGNRIGNAGASALSEALSSPNLQTLELIALDNNAIGDAGASSLFQRMSLSADADAPILHGLKTLTLSNNEINDASVVALSGAVAGGALRACKKLALDGNPASKNSVKGVKKALKKKGR